LDLMVNAKKFDGVRRRALAVIADSPEGRAEAMLYAHGFTPELLTSLIRDGLATAQTEHAGRFRPVEVRRFKITDAGRHALEKTSPSAARAESTPNRSPAAFDPID
jgi:hypothetical protein